MVWNGYDGRIYISSAFHLADQAFQPARVLVENLTEEQKNWYPTLISESLGDRLGGEQLHLYWRDFNEGLAARKSIFRKATLEIQLNDNSASSSSPSTPVSTSLSVSTSTSTSASPITTTTTTTPGEIVP